MSNALFNPFDHPLEAELPHPIQDEAGWTEHYYFWFYDPRTEFGLYIHSGRILSDRTIWRPVVQIYLPGQQFLVTTLHGRDGDRFGPGAGPLKINCIDPHRTWSIHFDGAGYRASREQLMDRLIGEGPAEDIRFSLVFDGAAPNFGRHVWGENAPVARFHTEQICNVRGHFIYDGKIIPVSGGGARDHSAGPRDYGPVVGDIWFQCLFEDGDAIMVQVVHFDEYAIKASYYYKAGSESIEDLTIIEHPRVAEKGVQGQLHRDPLKDEDANFVIRLARANGEEIRLDCELLNACAVTLVSPLEEYNGTGRGDGLQMAECVARVRWGDKVGYANRERSARLENLKD